MSSENPLPIAETIGYDARVVGTKGSREVTAYSALEPPLEILLLPIVVTGNLPANIL